MGEAITRAAEASVALTEKIGALESERQTHNFVLEDAAHGFFKADHRYRRAFQAPEVIGVDTETRTVTFKITNGRDHGDDFEDWLTFEELAMNPSRVAGRYNRRAKAAEKKAATRALHKAQEQARRLG